MSPFEVPHVQANASLRFFFEMDFIQQRCKTFSPALNGSALTTDGRYRQLDLSLSMYDLQNDNGVLDPLESRPHYTFAVFPGSSIKRDVTYNAYVRPTIDWSLECDLNT